jgi:tripartite-type tricarboxylate transporter receptor subunit TctC
LETNEMKRFVHGLMTAIAACLSVAATAQDAYPAKNIELILPYAAGGGVDAMARAFAREASRLTQSPWTVVNRDGAAGLVGFTALANSSPDGYTLVFSPASPLVISPWITRTMPFRSERITPVCQVFENVFTIAVRTDSPIRSVPELIALARSNPGKLSYGHAGTGSVPHLSIAALEKSLGVRFNPVPYRGDGHMIPQLMSGELDFGTPAISSIGGKPMRLLAVLADKRQPGAPDAPAITQLGLPPVTPGLNGIYAPTGTPPAVLEKLQSVCQRVSESEDFRRSAQTLQQVPAWLNAAQFRQRIDETARTNGELIAPMNLEKN